MNRENTRRTINPKEPNHLLIRLGVVVVALIINLSLLNNGFVSLDGALILDNPNIRSLRNLPDMFMSLNQTDYRPAYRPLTQAAFMTNYFLWRLDPTGWHLASLLVHIITILLVYSIFRRVAARDHKAAFLGSILYALHPIHVESVAFISGGSGLFGTMFGAGSFLFLLRMDATKPLFKKMENEYSSNAIARSTWLEARDVFEAKIKPVMFSAFPAILYLLGMLCWEYVMVIPAFLLLFDLTLNRKNLSDSKAIIRRAASAYLPLVISLIAYLVLRSLAKQDALAAASPLMRYGNVPSRGTFGILSRYLVLMIFPVRSSYLEVLKPDYPMWLSLGILTIFGVLFLYFLFKKPLLSFALGFMMVPALASAIRPVDNLIAERMIHLSLPGFCLFAGGILAHFTEWRPHFLDSNKNLVIAVISLSLMIFYLVQTHSRNKDWRSDITLWRREVALHPNSSFAQNKLGLGRYKTGFVEEAEKSFRKAIEIDSGFAPAYHNLARLLIDGKRFDEGKKVLALAEINGDDSDDASLAIIALMYLELGEKDAAERCFRKALVANPENTTALSELGSALFEKGLYAESLEYFNRALESASGKERATLLSNRSIILYKTGNPDQSAEDSLEALRLNPQLSHPYLTLASIESKRKFPEKSIALLEEALQKVPNPPFDVYFALHQLYDSFNQPQKSFDALYEYLARSPEDIRAQIAVGKYCLSWHEKNPEDESKLHTAITCFKNAHKLDPRNQEVLIYYGKTAVLAGDAESAEKIWKQALQINPNNVEAQRLLRNLKSGATY